MSLHAAPHGQLLHAWTLCPSTCVGWALSAVDPLETDEVLCEGVGQEEEVDRNQRGGGESVEAAACCTEHDHHQEEDQEEEQAELGMGEEGVQPSTVQLLWGGTGERQLEAAGGSCSVCVCVCVCSGTICSVERREKA